MKFNAVVIADGEGERRLTLGELPLKIGAGVDCEIRLPGPGRSAVGLLDELDGEPFVQPIGNQGALEINGEVLVASQKVASGDELQFYGSRVVVGESDGAMHLKIQLETSAYVTKPPEVAVAAGDAGEETIVATEFRRAREAAPVIAEPGGIRWQVVVGGVIGVLVLLSWLLFTSTSIQFDVQPAGMDELSVEGGWFKLPVGERVLMRTGTYTVNVAKQGYFDVAQSFEVGDEPSRTVVVEMRKLPGKLTVSTVPQVEAIVTVDDTRVGPAPLGPVELEPGIHSVTVSAERYLPYVQRISIPGLGLHQELDVQLVPQWADVEISSNPSGAAVYQGTQEIGETPMRLELMEGSHSLSLIKDGFKAWDGSVETVADIDQVLPTVELEPANAQLRVLSIPSKANISVNGRYRGQSPVKIDLSPDVDYEIGLSKAGYGSATRRVRLEAAASKEITVDMTARVGQVTVNVLPGEATVYVDGQAKGKGSITVNLSSAPHRLEVKQAGYAEFARTVTPRPGYPQTINVRLLSDAEVVARSTARSITSSQGQEMRRVEAGEFSMGTSRREQGRRANEVLVPVTISKPFYIGTKEVSNREYRRFRGGHDSGGTLHVALAGDLNPVANIGWEDAVDYCNWLSAEEGLTPAYEKVFERWQPIRPTPNGYRLPTEAEWAWAIRHQSRAEAATFPWGGRMPPRRDSGNYAGSSASTLVASILPGWDDGYASTAPVGTFAPNRLGLYDGGGNVAEWVQDYYTVGTPGRTERVIDPQGPPRGSNRVIRGSSWMHSGIMQLRLGYRDFGQSGRPDVGFRIARNVE